MGGLFGDGADIFGPQGLLGMLGLAGKPQQQQMMPQMPSGEALMGGAQVPQMPMQQMPQQAKKPGFNEAGGWGEKLQTVGAMLRDDPGIYSQMLAQKQADHRAQQQAMAQQQQQEAENAQWYEREGWKLKNKPASDDSFSRALEMGGIQPGTPEYISLSRKRASHLADPPLYRVGPDGQYYPIATGTGMLPTAPVGKLTPMGGTAPSGQVPLLPRR